VIRKQIQENEVDVHILSPEYTQKNHNIRNADKSSGTVAKFQVAENDMTN
jgi:hypothetical protein